MNGSLNFVFYLYILLHFFIVNCSLCSKVVISPQVPSRLWPVWFLVKLNEKLHCFHNFVKFNCFVRLLLQPYTNLVWNLSHRTPWSMSAWGHCQVVWETVTLRVCIWERGILTESASPVWLRTKHQEVLLLLAHLAWESGNKLDFTATESIDLIDFIKDFCLPVGASFLLGCVLKRLPEYSKISCVCPG